MFRTTMKALSLFRNNSSHMNHSQVTFKKREKPTFYNGVFNILIPNAVVKDSGKNTNSQLYNCIENYNNDLKIICHITGCEKNKKDCSCENVCIVTKSETSMICDLLQ